MKQKRSARIAAGRKRGLLFVFREIMFGGIKGTVWRECTLEGQFAAKTA